MGIVNRFPLRKVGNFVTYKHVVHRIFRRFLRDYRIGLSPDDLLQDFSHVASNNPCRRGRRNAFGRKVSERHATRRLYRLGVNERLRGAERWTRDRFRKDDRSSQGCDPGGKVQASTVKAQENKETATDRP